MKKTKLSNIDINLQQDATTFFFYYSRCKTNKIIKEIQNIIGGGGGLGVFALDPGRGCGSLMMTNPQ